MTQPGRPSARNSALFLSPEEPVTGAGGGGLRSASLLEYLRGKYEVTVARFNVPYHSRAFAARVWRNGWRLLRGVPPLVDRFAGFEAQLGPVLRGRPYEIGVVEHFWCAPYARALRPHCRTLVLDLHNVESELARTHARAAGGFQGIALGRFADAYKRLEDEWLPQFDRVLVASEDDARRVRHPDICVYPNALPVIEVPRVVEEHCIAFSGNLEYHPNIEAVRWFAREIWPRVSQTGEWRLVGCNEHAVRSIVKSDRRITFTGAVKDAVAELARAAVCVAPLRSGSGTRFKILEAWAAGRAVVSTTLGAEGLGAQSGEHLWIADEPAEFAAAVDALLADADRRRALGEAGRRLYLEKFTWPAAWARLTL
ncbi:MAG TPA: glycosyltransferase [Bryobacteraceae bacterium]|nr:glycosyltransferase [Bryobacteraceae bacterium]